MNHGIYWKLVCVLLLLGSACGDDDDQGMDEPAATRDEGDEDTTDPEDEGDPADDEGSAGGGEAGGGADDEPAEAGKGSVPGPDSGTSEDAATPPAKDAGETEPPADAAVAEDAAAPATDCDSLAACCEQLPDRAQSACEDMIESADDEACAAFAMRACGGTRDGGAAPMPCEAVLACCAELEGREQAACEAAAAAPEGRACDRAIETYCGEQP